MVIAKAVLCGAPGVGKTQLFNLLGSSREFESQYEPSQSPDFTSFNFKVTENEECLIQLWEVPGNFACQAESPEMLHLSQCTLRDAHVIIMVCDLTNAASINYFTSMYELVKTLHMNKTKPLYSAEVRTCLEQFSPQFKNSTLYSAMPAQYSNPSKSMSIPSLPEFIILVNKVEANQRHQQQILPTHQRAFAQERDIRLFGELSCALYVNVDSVRQLIGATAAVRVYENYKLHAGYLTQKKVLNDIKESFELVLRKHDKIIEKKKCEILAERERQREEEERERIRLERQREPFPPEMEFLRLRQQKQVWGRDLLVDWCYRYMGASYVKEVGGTCQLDRDREQHPQEEAWQRQYEADHAGLRSWQQDEPEYVRNSTESGLDWRTLGLLRRSLTFREDHEVESIARMCDLVGVVGESNGDAPLSSDGVPLYNVSLSHTSLGSLDSASSTLNGTNCDVSLSMLALIQFRLGIPGYYAGRAPIQLFLFLQRQTADLDKLQEKYNVNDELNEAYAPSDMLATPQPVLSEELVEKQRNGIIVPAKPRPLEHVLPLHFVLMQHKDARSHLDMHLTQQRNTIRQCQRDSQPAPAAAAATELLVSRKEEILSVFDEKRVEDAEQQYQAALEEEVAFSPRKGMSGMNTSSSLLQQNSKHTKNTASTESLFRPAHEKLSCIEESLYLDRLRRIAAEMDVDFNAATVPFPIVVLLLHNILYGEAGKQLELAWVTLCQSVVSQQTTTLKNVQNMASDTVAHGQAARLLYRVSSNPAQTMKSVYQQSQRGSLVATKVFAEELRRRFLFTLTREDVISGMTAAPHLIQPWLLHPLHLKQSTPEQHSKKLVQSIRNDVLLSNAVKIANDVMKYKPLITKHLRQDQK